MMELFRGFVEYFFKSEADINEVGAPLSLEEALSILSREEKVQISNPVEKEVEDIPDNLCFEATGKITHVDLEYGLIDRKLYFEHSKMSALKVGMTVQYLGYKKDGVVKVSKIIIVDPEENWNEGIMTENRNICDVTVTTQVVSREGRIVRTDKNIDIDLNKVDSVFIPMTGDWLSIICIAEVDETKIDLSGRILDIKRITPVRINLINGIVKFYDRVLKSGQINGDILFYKDSCAPGYVPIVNDKIIAEVIESENGKYTWRALKVMPIGSTIKKCFIAPVDKSDKELFRNKNDIVLSEHISANLNKIGEKQIIIIEVRNNGQEVRTITSVQFKSSAHVPQLTLESPSLDNNIMIRPNQIKIFKISCEALFMGTTKELMIMSFEGFRIGRSIKIMVVPSYKMNVAQRGQHKSSKMLASKAWVSYQNMNKEVIAGQRPVKPPSFISNKLPSFDIPDRLARHIFGLMSEVSLAELPVKEISGCLGNDLNIQNYLDVFHDLLFLEEIAIMVNMRRYDMELASFIKNNDFLMLEVPELSEKRPSVIVGDKVFAIDPNNPKKRFEGHVHKTGCSHLFLKFNQNFHNAYKGEDYSVEFHSSRTNFRRYHQAVDLAYRNLGEKILFPTSVKTKPPQVLFECDDDKQNEEVSPPKIKSKYVRMARKSLKLPQVEEAPAKHEEVPAKPPEASAKPLTTPAQPTEESSSKLKLEWFDKKLNKFQKAAVKNILLGVARPLPYFIFGPPGTGKTVTLIETILQILRMVPNSRLLVTAPSNSAADLIALRLLDSGVLNQGDLVRMVAYRCIVEGTIPQRLVRYCVTGDLAREGSRENRNSIQNGVTTNMQASALGRHRITVGTCMVVGVLYAMGFAKGHFTHIIVDEAGQATEPEMMIPASLMDVTGSQMVLAGDPMQLGPCVFSMISKEYGLGDSYFERLICKFPYDRDVIGFPDSGGYDPRLVTRLVYNYRSLPELLRCPNELFYQNELRPTICAETSAESDLLRKVSPLLPPRNGRLPPALIFHGVRGQNYQISDSPSWFNPIEAGQIFFYVNDLYNLGIQPEEIGVITPYIRQGQHVRELLNQSQLSLPKIGSVEEFQGQEFKIVILSCVRSNEIAAQNDSRLGLGFISSPRRLNVAISRAQVLLIIIGNPHLLIMDKYWRNVLTYAVEIGGYTGCDLPNLAGG